MATEYIKREDARTLLFDRLIETANNNTGYQCDSGIVYQDAAERLRLCWLNEVPAADVVERKRGKWMKVMLDHEAFGVRPTAHYCSECHQIIAFRTFYCPNCGADMRGDSDV